MKKLLLFMLFSTFTSASYASICMETDNYGKVSRILPWTAAGGTVFTLGGTNSLTNAVNITNGTGAYLIKVNPNTVTVQSMYRSTHDLLVEAAKNGWTIKVRTTNCVSAMAYAPVEFLYVDFSQN